MYRGKRRYGKNPKQIIKSKTTFSDPLKWKDSKLIFTCSWSDWFIQDADNWRDEAWDIIKDSPQHIFQILTKRPERIIQNLPIDWWDGWENVWIGVSIENQEYIFRKEQLGIIPAQVKFISAEPLLGPIDLKDLSSIDWVITGGESGPGARPMDINWVRSIRDQCEFYGIPFFHKQNGGTKMIDGAWGGRLIDGKIWNGIPERNLTCESPI